MNKLVIVVFVVGALMIVAGIATVSWASKSMDDLQRDPKINIDYYWEHYNESRSVQHVGYVLIVVGGVLGGLGLVMGAYSWQRQRKEAVGKERKGI